MAADRTGTDLEVGHLYTSNHQPLSDARAGAGNLPCSAVVKVTDGSIDSKERN
ncbi:hypothetical protein ACU610_07370 [Geodermatophilus sp. URMC 61]|uniref:hypothetical protein n=1 Tax=Geodermatophilus sp. URMC 61 TaxID=3423411 RepID=UPI00406CEDE1